METLDDNEAFWKWLYKELPAYLKEDRKNANTRRKRPPEISPRPMKYMLETARRGTYRMNAHSYFPPEDLLSPANRPKKRHRRVG